MSLACIYGFFPSRILLAWDSSKLNTQERRQWHSVSHLGENQRHQRQKTETPEIKGMRDQQSSSCKACFGHFIIVCNFALQAYPNGKVTQAQFQQLYQEQFPHGDSSEVCSLWIHARRASCNAKQLPSSQTSNVLWEKRRWVIRTLHVQNVSNAEISSIQFAENVFRSFDKDGDQLLDFREFMCGLSITSTASKKDQLKWAFEMYDIDGSGLISLDECITVIKVCMPSPTTAHCMSHSRFQPNQWSTISAFAVPRLSTVSTGAVLPVFHQLIPKWSQLNNPRSAKSPHWVNLAQTPNCCVLIWRYLRTNLPVYEFHSHQSNNKFGSRGMRSDLEQTWHLVNLFITDGHIVFPRVLYRGC